MPDDDVIDAEVLRGVLDALPGLVGDEAIVNGKGKGGKLQLLNRPVKRKRAVSPTTEGDEAVIPAVVAAMPVNEFAQGFSTERLALVVFFSSTPVAYV